jgi:hypothetical protein
VGVKNIIIMKKLIYLLPFFLILLSSFTHSDSNSIELDENLNCSELTFTNSGYATKNVYVYGKKLGEERWLAASFGLGAGKSTSLDTSESGFMVQWEVEVDGWAVSGYGCAYNF